MTVVLCIEGERERDVLLLILECFVVVVVVVVVAYFCSCCRRRSDRSTLWIFVSLLVVVDFETCCGFLLHVRRSL
jgi:uncharacterized membrane protein YoaK (UPF0700 family)